VRWPQRLRWQDWCRAGYLGRETTPYVEGLYDVWDRYDVEAGVSA
jgi:hypothetical protein